MEVVLRFTITLFLKPCGVRREGLRTGWTSFHFQDGQKYFFTKLRSRGSCIWARRNLKSLGLVKVRRYYRGTAAETGCTRCAYSGKLTGNAWYCFCREICLCIVLIFSTTLNILSPDATIYGKFQRLVGTLQKPFGQLKLFCRVWFFGIKPTYLRGTRSNFPGKTRSGQLLGRVERRWDLDPQRTYKMLDFILCEYCRLFWKFFRNCIVAKNN
jgi:hypothetical protein